jgi:hypothetical protein
MGAALWLLDQYFVNLLIGARGVDLHSDDTVESPFVFKYGGGSWMGFASPLYYAMLAFAQAVGGHARLLVVPTFRAQPTRGANVHLFAIRERSGELRVVVINKDLQRSGRVRLSVAHGRRAARLAVLRGPSPSAVTGVTLAGQSVAGDGSLQGAARYQLVRPSRGVYSFFLNAASAATLVIPAPGR